MQNTHTHTASGSNSSTAQNITPDERRQMLLDDLRVETRRLADAIETQNELLEELAADGSGVAKPGVNTDD